MKKTVSMLIAILLLFTQASAALAAQTNPKFAIPDGEWQGSMSAFYLWELSGMSGSWTWSGEMGFVSAAGELTGQSGVKGSGSVEGPNSYGIATLNSNVSIFGSSFAPEFQAMSGSIDMTLTVQGFTTDVRIPIEASGTVAVPIKLITVTCSQADGQWDDFTNQQAASMNVTVSGVTTIWAAVRTADLAPEAQSSYQDRMDALMEQANDLLKDVKANQVLDANALQSLITNAEELAAALRKNLDCGFANQWSFALPVASLVAQLIDFATKNPGYFTNLDVFLLTEAAIETGVIGAGAVNQDLATEVTAQLEWLVSSKLTDLESAGGGCQALMPLWVASNWVGGNAQTQASGLYTQYGCAP